jgi:hypothetical protein
MAEGSNLGDEGEQQQGESIGDSTSVDELSDSAVLRALARAVARTRAGRVLSFHSRAKVGDGCVTAFATPENQQQLQQLLQEFGADWVQGLRLEGLTAEDGGRQKLLQDFDATPDGEVFTLASCRTIGEGVDTKNANMVFFADPRGSYAANIQVGTMRCTLVTPSELVWNSCGLPSHVVDLQIRVQACICPTCCSLAGPWCPGRFRQGVCTSFVA